MEQYKVQFDLLPWEEPMHGVRYKAYREGGRQVRLVEFARDFSEPDWCEKGHIGYVLEGRGEIDFDGHLVEYGPGDGIFIPPGRNSKHMLRVLSNVIRVFLVEDVS